MKLKMWTGSDWVEADLSNVEGSTSHLNKSAHFDFIIIVQPTNFPSGNPQVCLLNHMAELGEPCTFGADNCG